VLLMFWSTCDKPAAVTSAVVCDVDMMLVTE
jgi:hypothetical protein